MITQEIYDARSRTVRFVPVMLTTGQEPFIPEPLRGHTSYELTSEERYQDLYGFLLGARPASSLARWAQSDRSRSDLQSL